MIKNKLQKKVSAFTLIELMVVITIIGILAVIILPNLGSITGRGQDTAIKEQMVQFRVTAGEYYADNYGFTTGPQALPVNSVACLSSGGGVNSSLPSGSIFTSNDFVRVAAGIKNNAGTVSNCYLGAGTVKSNTWAMVTKMRKSGFWCVDSTGNSKALTAETGVIDGSGEAVCP